MSDSQERRNRRIAKTRARVEPIYASLEQMGGKALRSIGLERATLHLHWKAAVYNLRRLWVPRRFVWKKAVTMSAGRSLWTCGQGAVGGLSICPQVLC